MSGDERWAAGGKKYHMDSLSSYDELEDCETTRPKQRYNDHKEKERRPFQQNREDYDMYVSEEKDLEKIDVTSANDISGHDYIREPDSRRGEKMKRSERAEDETSNRQQYATKPKITTPLQGDENEGESSDDNRRKTYRDHDEQSQSNFDQDRSKALPINHGNVKSCTPMQVDSSESDSDNQFENGFQSTRKNNSTGQKERSFHNDRDSDADSRNMEKYSHRNNLRKIKTSARDSSESAEERMEQEATERRDAVHNRPKDTFHQKDRDEVQQDNSNDTTRGNYRKLTKDNYERKIQIGGEGTDSERESQNTRGTSFSNQKDSDSEEEYRKDNKMKPGNARNIRPPKQKDSDSDSEDYRKASKDKTSHRPSSQGKLRKSNPELHDESDSDKEREQLKKKGSQNFNQNLSSDDDERGSYANEDIRPQRRPVQRNKGTNEDNYESKYQRQDFDGGKDHNRQHKRCPAEYITDDDDTEKPSKYQSPNSDHENEERGRMSKETQPRRRPTQRDDSENDSSSQRSQRQGNEDPKSLRRPTPRDGFENYSSSQRSDRQGNDENRKPRRPAHRDEGLQSDYRKQRSQRPENDEDRKPRRRSPHENEDFENDHGNQRSQRPGNDKDWRPRRRSPQGNENFEKDYGSCRQGKDEDTNPQRRPARRDEDFMNGSRNQGSRTQRNYDYDSDDENDPERGYYMKEDTKPRRRPVNSDYDYGKGYEKQRSMGQAYEISDDEKREQRRRQFHGSRDDNYVESRSTGQHYSDEYERDYIKEDTKPRRRPITSSEVPESSYKHRESGRHGDRRYDNHDMEFEQSTSKEYYGKPKEKQDIPQTPNDAEYYGRRSDEKHQRNRERNEGKTYNDEDIETASQGKRRSRANRYNNGIEYDQEQCARRGYDEKEAFNRMERMSINDDAQENRYRKSTKDSFPDNAQDYYNREGKCSSKYGSGANYSYSDETFEDHGYQSGRKPKRSQLRYDERDQKRQYSKFSSSALIAILMQCDGFKVSIETLMKRFGLEPQEVWRVVHRHSDLFQIAKNRIIYLQPQIGICNAHLNQGCINKSSCFDLHVCSRFIQNSCPRSDCMYGHNLSTKHNKSVLQAYKLDNIIESRLLEIFYYSIPVVPTQKSAKQLRVCHDYNNGMCGRTYCNYLHICDKFFATMQCNGSCNLSHELLSKANSQILHSHGIETNETPRDIIRSLRESLPHLFRDQKSVGGSGINQSDLKVKGKSDKVNEYSGATNTRSTTGATRARPTTPEFANDRKDFNSSSLASASAKGAFNSSSSAGRSTQNYLYRGDINNPVAIGSGGSIWADDYLGNVQRAEICYYSVTSRCKFESEGCKRLHAKDHFHWQVKERGKGWVNLRKDQVNVLEKAYCDPSQDGTVVPPVNFKNCPSGIIKLFGQDSWHVDFTAMLMGNPKTSVKLDLRRLCSEDVDGSITFQWYFLDQNKTWVEYGNVDTTKRDFLKSSITSQQIEKQYLQNPFSSITFKNDMFTYSLCFRRMTQMNMSTNVVREVRRRPKPQAKKGGVLGFMGWR